MKQPFTKLDPATFLNTPATKVLMTMLMLPEHQVYAHKITGLLSQSFQQMNAVMDIQGKRGRESTLLMWRKHYLDGIDGLPSVPDKLKTYAKNIVVTYCRECLHESRNRDTRGQQVIIQVREIGPIGGGSFFPHITFKPPISIKAGAKLILDLKQGRKL